VSNKLPLLGFLSEPGMFDPIAIWEEFLAEVQTMPDFVWKESVIENAKWVIAQKRQCSARVEWLPGPTVRYFCFDFPRCFFRFVSFDFIGPELRHFPGLRRANALPTIFRF
jgi:hypothetical protein